MEPVEQIRASRPHPPCQRPLVTISYAQSLDGSIAVRGDAPLALSCPETKLMTHALRSVHDAILVGINTVLADDPKLTARRVGGPHPRPVVLDTRLRFPDAARLLHHPQGVIIATGPEPSPERVQALRDQGATVLPLPRADEGVDVLALLQELAKMGICSLMVEGGARVLTSFLRARLGDWLVLTVTPHLVGGVHALSGPTVVAHVPPAQVDMFPGLQAWHWTPMGRDMVVWGRMAWPA